MTSSAPRLNAQLILLVDPDPDSRTVYGTMLRHLGAVVLEVATATEALEVARREPVTVAVAELLHLPDGESLLHALRRDNRTQHIPIYVVTADTRADHHRDAHQAGASVRIKPLAPRALVNWILSPSEQPQASKP
jgi:CheY-like chemotaxis protein